MRRGFTLVEVLISTFLFGSLIAMVIGFLVPSNQASRRTRSETELNDASSIAFARIARDANGACELGATSSGTLVGLVLNRYDASGDIVAGQFDTDVYRVSGGTLTCSRGASNNQLLSGLVADVIPFQYYDANLAATTPALARMLRVTLHLRQASGHVPVDVVKVRDFRLRNAR